MQKKRIAPAFIIIAIALMVLFKLLPALYTLAMSMQDIKVRNGLFDSEFIGLTNYVEYIRSYYFGRLLRNTAILTLLPALLTALCAFVLTLSVSRLPGRWSKCAVLMVLAVPAFVPATVLAALVESTVSVDGPVTLLLSSMGLTENKDLLVQATLYPAIYSVFETLRFLFFPVLAGVLALEGRSERRGVMALKVAVGYILARLTMTFIFDTELSSLLYRPIIFSISDTVSSFYFRRGIAEGDLTFAAAVEAVRVVMQLILNAGALLGLWALFRKRDDSRESTRPARRGAAGMVLAAVVTVVFCAGAIFVILAMVFPGILVKGAVLSFAQVDVVGRKIANSFAYAIPAGVLTAAFAFFIAYPLAAGSKSVRVLAGICLSISGNIAAYLIFKKLGLVNNGFGAAVYGTFSIFAAIALAYSVRGRLIRGGFSEYASRAWRGVIVLALAGFAVAWSSSANEVLLLTSRRLDPVEVMLRELQLYSLPLIDNIDKTPVEMAGIISGISLVSSLPPVVAVWLTLLLGKKLPSGLLCSGLRK